MQTQIIITSQTFNYNMHDRHLIMCQHKLNVFIMDRDHFEINFDCLFFKYFLSHKNNYITRCHVFHYSFMV